MNRGDERLLAAYEAAADEALATVSDACARTSGDWADGVHAGLAALLDFVASSSPRTYMVDALDLGAPGLERHERTLERFAELLAPGYALADPPPPAIAAEAVVGGIFELIRAYVVEDRAEAVPDALPTITIIALTPFVGSDEAERIAARPSPTRAGH